jgi:hypothetical protein
MSDPSHEIDPEPYRPIVETLLRWRRLNPDWKVQWEERYQGVWHEMLDIRIRKGAMYGGLGIMRPASPVASRFEAERSFMELNRLRDRLIMGYGGGRG